MLDKRLSIRITFLPMPNIKDTQYPRDIINKDPINSHTIAHLRSQLKVISDYLESQKCNTDNSRERYFITSCILLLDTGSTNALLSRVNYETVKNQTAELIANTNTMLLEYVKKSQVTHLSPPSR